MSSLTQGHRPRSRGPSWSLIHFLCYPLGSVSSEGQRQEKPLCFLPGQSPLYQSFHFK